MFRYETNKRKVEKFHISYADQLSKKVLTKIILKIIKPLLSIID